MSKKFLSFIYIFILFFLVFPKNAHAIENFDTVYNVTYAIGEDAVTKATIQVALTNTSDRYYADSYSLQVGFDDITDVKATDPDGQLAPKITKNDDGQKIELTFNKKVLGKGKTLNFTLSFDTPDVARKQGKIWEINIPGITRPDEFKDFNVTVKPPYFLDNPLYIKPHHIGKELKFTKDELGHSGISMAFGKEQLYDYKIRYHLQNDNIFPIKRKIALPPTTNYQKVYLESLSPRPDSVIRDIDGNWLAEYTLSPGQKTEILAKGKVNLSLVPKKEALSSDLYNEYLKEDTYWEVKDPEIIKLAQNLKTPENIFKYVVENLKYDFTRVNTDQKRLGAKEVLSKKDNAVCLEFTDLFITLSRAAGIPAREVNGFALTENTKQRPLSKVQDILHAWPEYYDKDKMTWIMVDPTWSNTTGGVDYFKVFDLDHFVFVRKGINSTSPLPAGAYKTDDEDNKKDISITFAKTTGNNTEKFILEPDFGKNYSSQIPISGSIKIQNTGEVMINTNTLTLTSTNLTPHTQTATTEPIPPYGTQIVNASFNSLPFLTNNDYDFRIKLQSITSGVKFHISPFGITIDRLLILAYVTIAAIIIWGVAQGTWSLFIRRQRR